MFVLVGDAGGVERGEGEAQVGAVDKEARGADEGVEAARADETDLFRARDIGECQKHSWKGVRKGKEKRKGNTMPMAKDHMVSITRARWPLTIWQSHEHVRHKKHTKSTLKALKCTNNKKIYVALVPGRPPTASHERSVKKTVSSLASRMRCSLANRCDPSPQLKRYRRLSVNRKTLGGASVMPVPSTCTYETMVRTAGTDWL